MKNILFILLSCILFVSCSKEIRIERNLWKQSGEWNIESWKESGTNSYYPEENYTIETYNSGTFRFNEDGTGSLTFYDGTVTNIGNFTYENTKEDLTIFDDDENGVTYDIEWRRNELFLTSLDTIVYEGLDENFNPVMITETNTKNIKIEKD